MIPKSRGKIDGWFHDERMALIAKGATPDDTKEEAFIKLLANNVEARHWDETEAAPELSKELVAFAFKTARRPGLAHQARQETTRITPTARRRSQ
jgi:hypothetical protein